DLPGRHAGRVSRSAISRCRRGSRAAEGGRAMKVQALAIAAVLAASGPALAQETTAPVEAPAAEAWRTVPAENLLVIDTNRGRILVEMVPQIAPAHVDRMRLLARRGFFDGLVWHRVIDWFMAQTGDPLGSGEGQSPYPDLPAE